MHYRVELHISVPPSDFPPPHNFRDSVQSSYPSLYIPALAGYLGDDAEAWKQYDATELVARGYSGKAPILIDVGTADPNLANQLMPEKFEAAAKKAGVQVRRPRGFLGIYVHAV